MDYDRKNGVVLQEAIGAGGFGTIYKCMYRGERCVVKKVQLKPDSISFKIAAAEFTVLSQIKHPRIVALIAFYLTPTHWNFVLEHMEAGSLRDILHRFIKNRSKISQDEMLEIFMDTVMGIRYLHMKNIIHRDIKPENILVDRKYRAKIADFGVSKIICSTDHHTCIGTMLYMAPEVFLHQPYDKSADVWGLGMVFYEMAMLSYPFTQADKARIMNSRLTYIPPKIDFQRRRYAPSVQDFLLLMLQRDPKLRASIQDLCTFPLVESVYKKLLFEESVVIRSQQNLEKFLALRKK